MSHWYWLDLKKIKVCFWDQQLHQQPFHHQQQQHQHQQQQYFSYYWPDFVQTWKLGFWITAAAQQEQQQHLEQKQQKQNNISAITDKTLR